MSLQPCSLCSARPKSSAAAMTTCTPFPVTLPDCQLPDHKKRHGLLAKAYNHLFHRAVLQQHKGEFESFPTNPFQLNKKGVAHSTRTWGNTKKQIFMLLDIATTTTRCQSPPCNAPGCCLRRLPLQSLKGFSHLAAGDVHTAHQPVCQLSNSS